LRKSIRLSLYITGSIAVLAYSYLIAQVEYPESREVFLLAPALLVALIILARPLWGIFLVLLLSPLQTLGDEVLLLTRLLGMWVVAVTFVRLLFVQRERIRWTGIEGPVLLMAAGMALSFFRSSDNVRVVGSILSLVSLYGLLLIIFTLVQDREELEKTLLVFLASAIYPMGQAIAQGLTPNPELTFTRVEGTFTLPTGLGAFLIPIVLFSLALVFYPDLSLPKRGFVLGTFGASVATLLLTLSRGSILGALVGGVVVYVALRPQLKSRSSTVAFLAVLTIISAWALWPSIEGRVFAPVVAFVRGGQSDLVVGVTQRADELSLLIPATLDTYFLGTGIGNYRELAVRYRVLYGLPNLPVVPHNVLLYFFAEVGIIGALGFIWLLVRLVWRVVASYRSMMETAPDLVFYVYAGSLGSLAGYVSFMITHSGLTKNEIWIAMAFFLASICLGKRKGEAEEYARVVR